MRSLILAVVVGVVSGGSAAAQVGTEPTAWAPEHRKLADAFGTIGVAGQAAGATWESVRAWRDGDRKPAWRNFCAAAVTIGSSEVAKRIILEPRPDGSDKFSKPSEHSGLAAALSHWNFTFSVPLAAFIGLSRANANKHHLWGDGKDIPWGWALGAGAQAACTALIR
jgi:hypothetical protein